MKTIDAETKAGRKGRVEFRDLFPDASAQDHRDEACAIGTAAFRLDEVTFSPISSPIRSLASSRPLIQDAPLGDAAWIDGGSAVIVATPSRAVCLVKTCVVRTEGLTRKGIAASAYLVSITARHEDFIIRALPVASRDARIDAALNTTLPRSAVAAASGEPATPAQAIDVVRRLAEWAVTAEGTVIRDGSLRTANAFLQERCAVRENEFALAKTSAALTDNGRPLATALLERASSGAPADAWSAMLCAISGISISAVRLHERAQHVFLLESWNKNERKDGENDGPARQQDDEDEKNEMIGSVMAMLRAWSQDAGFLGYPYPLVLADQIARVTDQERDTWRATLAADEGAMRVLAPELHASDAHDVLEHMLYGKERFWNGPKR